MVLPPYMILPLAIRWHTWDSTSSYSMKPCEASIERKMLGCWALSLEQYLQLSNADTTQTIGKLFAQYLGELCPKSPTFARIYISQCLTLTNKAPTH